MSRKKAGKAKKAAPIKLAWLDQIIRHEWPDKPAKNSMIAVGAILATYADPDGRNCFPSVRTVAGDAGIKYATAIDCIKTMRSAGMLEREGKASNGQNRYRLCLVAMPDETHPDIDQTALSVAPSVAPRGTQPPTLDCKGEGGGDRSPAGDTPTAVAAGANTRDAKTITTEVLIDDDRANQIIGEFITAFDATFANRERSSTVATRRLEPHNDKLRRQIITKIDAGWPLDHLIDRILADIPNDYKINSLTGLAAYKLQQLPDKPDATAYTVIKTREVAATAQLKLDEADRKRREAEKADKDAADLQEKKSRRSKAIRDFRQVAYVYGAFTDLDAGVAQVVADLDDEAQYEETPQAIEAWPLSDCWIEFINTEANELRNAAKAQRQEIDQLVGDAEKEFATHGYNAPLMKHLIDKWLTTAGLDRKSIYAIRNRDAAIASLRALIERNQPAELIQTSDGSDTW